MTKFLFRKRRWLNRLGHHSVAFIYGHLTQDEVGDEDIYTDGEIRVGDCNRMVSLQFYDDANSLYKLRTLIEFLEDYEAALKETVV